MHFNRKITLVFVAIFLAVSHGQKRRRQFTQNSVGLSGKSLQSLWSVAEENIRKPSLGRDRDLDLRLPHLVPAEDYPRGPLSFERNGKPELQRIFQWILNYLGNTSTDPKIVAEAKRQGKYQKQVPAYVPFPCDTTNGRSAIRPDRADRLRPGDIDVVAAFGDSMTAGNCIAGTNLLHEYITNRGLSAFVGGQGTWREYATVPNLLKEYNPNLTGYSLGDSMFSAQYYNQQLNLAETAAVTADLPDMAKALHRKMLKDPKINMKEDWKMITILIGSVDFCLDLCYWKRPQDGPASAERALRQTFDYLQENFPRTIVQFFVSLDIPKLIKSFKFTSTCKIVIPNSCPCILGKTFESVQDDYDKLVTKVLDAHTRAASDLKYKTKPDFRIVVHPMFRYEVNMPEIRRNGRNLSDLKYFAADCFHLSQIGQAWGGRNIWNSMFSKNGVSKKWNSKRLNFPEDLECPTSDHPYFNLD